jgi:hypothetical protein
LCLPSGQQRGPLRVEWLRQQRSVCVRVIMESLLATVRKRSRFHNTNVVLHPRCHLCVCVYSPRRHLKPCPFLCMLLRFADELIDFSACAAVSPLPVTNSTCNDFPCVTQYQPVVVSVRISFDFHSFRGDYNLIDSFVRSFLSEVASLLSASSSRSVVCTVDSSCLPM